MAGLLEKNTRRLAKSIASPSNVQVWFLKILFSLLALDKNSFNFFLSKLPSSSIGWVGDFFTSV